MRLSYTFVVVLLDLFSTYLTSLFQPEMLYSLMLYGKITMNDEG